jgi:hypothetical protein
MTAILTDFLMLRDRIRPWDRDRGCEPTQLTWLQLGWNLSHSGAARTKKKTPQTRG